ncbi:MAG: hypothetical protein ACREPG_00785, partial [Candidatus Binatia bacterium]
ESILTVDPKESQLLALLENLFKFTPIFVQNPLLHRFGFLCFEIIPRVDIAFTFGGCFRFVVGLGEQPGNVSPIKPEHKRSQPNNQRK